MTPSIQAPRERAVDLLARMTLVEKAQQVSAIMPNVLFGSKGISREALRTHLGEGIGHISNSGPQPPSLDLARRNNQIQRFLVEETRLGIPAISHAEALNGFLAPGYTSFPTAIGLAATWNPEAVREMSTLIGRQMKSVGVRQALSPVLDVSRDARWGRVHETYGEDPYLASAMGVAYVQGIQGEGFPRQVHATAKHFLGYSMTEAGQNMAETQMGSRELYDVYGTPFEAAVQLAGLASVMNSYSAVDGVPVGASHELLTELLRERMGFQGSVVSDYSTVEWLMSRQGIASSLGEAGIMALSAGLDVELPTIMGYGHNLVDAVTEGKLDEDILDEAVLRVLTDKFALGLFEQPYVKEDPIELNELASSGDQLATEITESSITLLKNDGVLPLRSSQRIAVIGPHANSSMVNFAAYTHPASIDMVKGLATGESRMAGVGGMMDSAKENEKGKAAQFARLAQVDTEQLVRDSYQALSLGEAIAEAVGPSNANIVTGVGLYPDEPQDIDSAVAAAKSADVVVLAIGGRAGWFGTKISEGEGTDSARIELSASQVELVKAVAATGTPLVAVMYQGRPYAIAEVEDLLDALLIGYYPGPRGARAITRVLFGEVNPSGRLPYTIPRTTGQVPIYYGQKRGSGFRREPADMFHSYIDEGKEPLYHFGEGLSYSSFEYGSLDLGSESTQTQNGTFTAAVTIANTSNRDGVEVVQLYSSVHARGVTRPALQLIGFNRTFVPAGERVRVTFTCDTSLLGYSGIDGRFTLDPGTVTLSAGHSSNELLATQTLVLTGDRADLEGRRSYLSSAVATPMP